MIVIPLAPLFAFAVFAFYFFGTPRFTRWYVRRKLRDFTRLPEARALRLPAVFTKAEVHNVLEVEAITHVGGSGMSCTANYHCGICHSFWRGDMRQCCNPHCNITDQTMFPYRKPS